METFVLQVILAIILGSPNNIHGQNVPNIILINPSRGNSQTLSPSSSQSVGQSVGQSIDALTKFTGNKLKNIFSKFSPSSKSSETIIFVNSAQPTAQPFAKPETNIELPISIRHQQQSDNSEEGEDQSGSEERPMEYNPQTPGHVMAQQLAQQFAQRYQPMGQQVQVHHVTAQPMSGGFGQPHVFQFKPSMSGLGADGSDDGSQAAESSHPGMNSDSGYNYPPEEEEEEEKEEENGDEYKSGEGEEEEKKKKKKSGSEEEDCDEDGADKKEKKQEMKKPDCSDSDLKAIKEMMMMQMMMTMNMKKPKYPPTPCDYHPKFNEYPPELNPDLYHPPNPYHIKPEPEIPEYNPYPEPKPEVFDSGSTYSKSPYPESEVYDSRTSYAKSYPDEPNQQQQSDQYQSSPQTASQSSRFSTARPKPQLQQRPPPPQNFQPMMMQYPNQQNLQQMPQEAPQEQVRQERATPPPHVYNIQWNNLEQQNQAAQQPQQQQLGQLQGARQVPCPKTNLQTNQNNNQIRPNQDMRSNPEMIDIIIQPQMVPVSNVQSRGDLPMWSAKTAPRNQQTVNQRVIDGIILEEVITEQNTRTAEIPQSDNNNRNQNFQSFSNQPPLLGSSSSTSDQKAKKKKRYYRPPNRERANIIRKPKKSKDEAVIREIYSDSRRIEVISKRSGQVAQDLTAPKIIRQRALRG